MLHALVKIYAETLNLWTHPADCRQYTTGPRAAHWIETSLDRTMRIPAVGSLRFLDHCQGENIGTSQSPRMRWLMIVRQCVERIDASLARYDQPNLYVSSNPLLPIGTANKTVLGIIVRWPASLYIVEYINMYYLQRINNTLWKNSWRIQREFEIVGKAKFLEKLLY